MNIGIAIVGGNGSGKSTLGKCLAALLGCRYMDVEDYYFRPSDTTYANPLTKEEVNAAMQTDINAYGSFVLSSVYGDRGANINARYTHIVYIEVPKEIRLQRVKQRSFKLFGSRMLPGGDLYASEQKFFDMVECRSLDKLDAWVQQMKLPVMYVDGTKPVTDNAVLIKDWLDLV
jgi:dephospho-CoA kinase